MRSGILWSQQQNAYAMATVEYDRIVKKHIYGNAPLWSPSYFVTTTGSVSMDVVKQYIEGQRTDEHKRKYEKRSLDYWNSRL